MSQPCTLDCEIPQPGEVDEELGEFWVGSPWEIFRQHNLSCFERNRAFVNVRGVNFLDVSYLTGADSDGDGRSAIAADLNGNGRLDLIVRQAGGGPLLVFENQFPQRRFLQVTLRGTRSNRLGIGARLVAHVAGRQIVREVFPVNSYRSQAPLVVHFGLEGAERVDRLHVRWPSGLEQEFHDVPADQHVVIEEGSGEIVSAIRGETIPP